MVDDHRDKILDKVESTFQKCGEHLNDKIEEEIENLDKKYESGWKHLNQVLRKINFEKDLEAIYIEALKLDNGQMIA